MTIAKALVGEALPSTPQHPPEMEPRSALRPPCLTAAGFMQPTHRTTLVKNARHLAAAAATRKPTSPTRLLIAFVGPLAHGTACMAGSKRSTAPAARLNGQASCVRNELHLIGQNFGQNVVRRPNGEGFQLPVNTH